MLADESYPNVTAPVLTDITITNNVVIDNEASGIRFWDGSFPGQSALKNVHHRQQHRGRQQDDCHQVGRGPAPEHRRGEQHLRRAVRVPQALLLKANSLQPCVSLDRTICGTGQGCSSHSCGARLRTHTPAGRARRGRARVMPRVTRCSPVRGPVRASYLQSAYGSPAIDTGKTLSAVAHDYNGAALPPVPPSTSVLSSTARRRRLAVRAERRAPAGHPRRRSGGGRRRRQQPREWGGTRWRRVRRSREQLPDGIG